MVCCGTCVHQEGGLRMTLGIRQYPHAVDLALTIVQKSVSKLPSGEDHRPDIDTSRPADAYAPSPRTPHLRSLPFPSRFISGPRLTLFPLGESGHCSTVLAGDRTTTTTPGERPDLCSGRAEAATLQQGDIRRPPMKSRCLVVHRHCRLIAGLPKNYSKTGGSSQHFRR